MKKTLVILMTVLMSITTSAFASTTTGKCATSSSSKSELTLSFDIPVNLIVKQIVTFKDGTSIEVYYQKDGNYCKLYSNVDVTKYTEKDLNRVKSTSFELSDHVEGKCYVKKRTADVMAMAKAVFRQLK